MTSPSVHVHWITDNSSQPRQGATRADAAIDSKSQAIRNAVAKMLPVAPTNSAVLLLGEVGVGKGQFAQAIHDASSRRHRQMVRVNAAAIPAPLESELFGRLLEEANGSTLFLHEVGELLPDAQGRLLRLLDEGTIARVGSGKSIAVDIRIIAATNRDLDDAVRNGQFREDLFDRLNQRPVMLEAITRENLNDLDQYSWPGDIRDLRNVIERTLDVAKSPTLAPWVPLAWSVSYSGSTQRYSVSARRMTSPPSTSALLACEVNGGR